MKQKELQLSVHFKLSEFADPSTGQAQVAMPLLQALEELRAAVGRPIKILSGFRSKDHNANVGGTANSRHLTGEAADISVQGMPLTELLGFALTVKAFEKSGIGYYPENGFIHVDIGRSKPARWARIGGKYVSLEEGLKHG